LPPRKLKMVRWYSEELGSIEGMRRGLSTGSCAQAAAKAALELLLSGEAALKPTAVDITLPAGKEPYSGKTVRVPVESAELIDGRAEALVRKDAGDDPDITNGLLIGARVFLTRQAPEAPPVTIDGAEGVGRITAGGLPGKTGEAAINPGPRAMIRRELEGVLPAGAGCSVQIFVPRGEDTAKKTWNPRIGISGGISIIGTKGVVEPKSEEAYKVSINRLIHSYAAQGMKDYIITPGYVGERYLSSREIPLERVVTAGDHIGHAMAKAASRGAESIHLVGHIGKLAKIAAGIFNTHWRSGDARLELIAAHAAACSADTETVRRIMALTLAEEAVSIIEEKHLQDTWLSIAESVKMRMELFLEKKGFDSVKCSATLLALDGRELGSIQ
jgi:cobalt-precorrin-5B (C1)-methyltransferase